MEPTGKLAPFDRALVLAASVGVMAAFWLEARCACGTCTEIPLRFLAAQGLRGHAVADVLLRLRCRRCNAAPVRVELVETPGGEGPRGYGAAGPWRVVLVERSSRAG